MSFVWGSKLPLRVARIARGGYDGAQGQRAVWCPWVLIFDGKGKRQKRGGLPFFYQFERNPNGKLPMFQMAKAGPAMELTCPDLDKILKEYLLETR